MSTGQLPASRRTCKHGLKLPNGRQVGCIAVALARKDFGGAIAVCVDWCDICTGLVDEVEMNGEKR